MATSVQYEAFRESWRPTQEKVDLAVKLAVEIAKPSRVFVFGSWARGAAGIDSDLDLAVFLPDAMKPIGGEAKMRLSRRHGDFGNRRPGQNPTEPGEMFSGAER